MQTQILAASDIGRAMSTLFRVIDQSGNGDLIIPIIIGVLLGGICSIPAAIVAIRRELPVAPIFWINAIAGGVAGIFLCIPSGIATLIYATARADPRIPKRADPNRVRWGSILTPVVLLIICLLVLPNTCTTSTTVVLPDDRSLWEKFRGDAIPTSTEEVTSWVVVTAITATACYVGFIIARLIEDDSRRPK